MGDPVHIGDCIPAMESAFKKMLEWQKTPEGIKARQEFEAKQEKKRRAELDEMCAIRGVPADIRTRPLALAPWESHNTLAAIAVYEAASWRDLRSSKKHRVGTTRFLIGSPGIGKTVAFAHAVAHHKLPAQFVLANDLEPKALQRNEELERRVQNVDLLAIDELGAERASDEIILLVQRRHDNGKFTLLASNLGARDVMDRYLGSAHGQRLSDRLKRQFSEGLKAMVTLAEKSLRHG